MIEHEFNTENFCLKRPPILMYKIFYNACSEQLNSLKHNAEWYKIYLMNMAKEITLN